MCNIIEYNAFLHHSNHIITFSKLSLIVVFLISPIFQSIKAVVYYYKIGKLHLLSVCYSG